MFRSTRLGSVSVAAALTLALAGCGATATQGGGTSDPTLTLGVLVPATTFAAQDINWANESPYGQAVYDGLLRAAPDGTIEPWLATKWTYDSAKTKLTLTLRTDVTFTDDTKFTADVAAQNVIRFRDGNSPNKSDLSRVADAKAVNESTLEISLKEPDPALLTALTQGAGVQESPKAFTSATIKTVPVGSGPYILDTGATVVGSSYVFTKNPKYWAPQTVHYDKLELKVYGDATALLNAIKGHQVDAANTPDNNSLDQMKAAGYTVNPLELNWTGLLLLDRAGTTNPALGDVRVRQAINYAFDKQALLKAVGKGYGTATTQVFPVNSPAYDKSLDSYYDYNPAKAKQLLADAGYAGGLTLKQPQSALIGPATYTLLAQQLKDVGITVQYTDIAQGYIAELVGAKWGSAYMILQEDSTAWKIATFGLLPNAAWNPFRYSDPTVVSLAGTIQNGSQADADEAAKKLNKYLVEQAWYAPWYRMQSSFVTDANTTVTVQQGNAYPYLWNFKPKS
ncbi:peptide/nickel transport system substrate-binding protein [Kibdelosporangium banguiense]|uniref:Peptide/nickel transport system substrate-binding protein n=1 Tax=Kibdelosporangium banguiense TaxID=1365924 RepID=A0ABS4TTY0_9PSEU|nr:ABC transporter substrate-binding protein [Kibdelosporangium banguiense]MBP2327861.1 peptide/nickel transport system substrate-binding protein [Kibdelosporangium banguiense]